MQETSNFANLLASINIFAKLDKETRKDVARFFKIERFEKGEKLIKRGEKADRFFVILQGRVELQTLDLLDNQQRKIILTDGSVLGEIALLTNAPYLSDAVALDKMAVFYLDKTDFNRLLTTHNTFAHVMTSLISGRMAHAGGINKVGRYTLTQKIGEGNMSMVFEGYDPELERHVALKMLKYELSHDKDFVARFTQEAKVIARLNHPNIVNVYETINEFTTSFIVMERLKGQDLGAILKHQGVIGIEQTKNILYQVACGLEYAHNLDEGGIIHRDIKPENIIIDHQGHIKLTDFGIAKPPTEVITTVIGTPKYLAPEIIRGEAFDGRADIYSLGITAYTLLTGSPPFSADTLDELLRMQVYETPPDIRFMCPDIDDTFKEFIDRALMKRPEERIGDWSIIKDMLSGESSDNAARVNNDDIVLLTRIQNHPQMSAEEILEKLSRVLDEHQIEHSIEILR